MRVQEEHRKAWAAKQKLQRIQNEALTHRLDELASSKKELITAFDKVGQECDNLGRTKLQRIKTQLDYLKTQLHLWALHENAPKAPRFSCNTVKLTPGELLTAVCEVFPSHFILLGPPAVKRWGWRDDEEGGTLKGLIAKEAKEREDEATEIKAKAKEMDEVRRKEVEEKRNRQKARKEKKDKKVTEGRKFAMDIVSESESNESDEEEQEEMRGHHFRSGCRGGVGDWL